MTRTRKKRQYASVTPDEEFFWRCTAERRLYLVEKAKRNPREWRCALLVKQGHQPEAWTVGPNGLGRDVQFRISRIPNAAGYFVGWRSVQETDGPRAVYDYVADKDRAICRTKTLALARRYATIRGNAKAVAALDAELARAS
jgi:hypothetical protein